MKIPQTLARGSLQVVGAPTVPTSDPQGAAAAQLAETAGTTARRAAYAYARVKDDDDQRQAREAFLGLNDDVRETLYGADGRSGLMNAEGAAAQGSSEAIGKAIAEATQARGKGLTPGAMAYFNDKVGSWRDSLLDTAANRESQQLQALDAMQRAAEFDIDSQGVFRAPGTLQAAQERAMQRARDDRRLTPELQNALGREQSGKLAVVAAMAVIDSDPAQAAAIVAANADVISPAARETLDAKIKKQEVEVKALADAKAMMGMSPAQAMRHLGSITDPALWATTRNTYNQMVADREAARARADRAQLESAQEDYLRTGQVKSWYPADFALRVRSSANETTRKVGNDALTTVKANLAANPDWWGSLPDDQQTQWLLDVSGTPGGPQALQAAVQAAQNNEAKVDASLLAEYGRPYFEAAGVKFTGRKTQQEHEHYLRLMGAWQQGMQEIRTANGRNPLPDEARTLAQQLTAQVRVPTLGRDPERYYFDLWEPRPTDTSPLRTAYIEAPEEKVAALRPQAIRNLQRGRQGRPSESAIEDEINRIYTNQILGRH